MSNSSNLDSHIDGITVSTVENEQKYVDISTNITKMQQLLKEKQAALLDLQNKDVNLTADLILSQNHLEALKKATEDKVRVVDYEKSNLEEIQKRVYQERANFEKMINRNIRDSNCETNNDFCKKYDTENGEANEKYLKLCGEVKALRFYLRVIKKRHSELVLYLRELKERKELLENQMI